MCVGVGDGTDSTISYNFLAAKILQGLWRIFVFCKIIYLCGMGHHLL